MNDGDYDCSDYPLVNYQFAMQAMAENDSLFTELKDGDFPGRQRLPEGNE